MKLLGDALGFFSMWNRWSARCLTIFYQFCCGFFSFSSCTALSIIFPKHVSQLFFFSFFTFNKETKKSTLENASTASKFKSYAPIFKEKKMRKERNYNLSYTEARAKELPYILTVDSNRNPSVLPTNNFQDT